MNVYIYMIDIDRHIFMRARNRLMPRVAPPQGVLPNDHLIIFSWEVRAGG